MITTRTATPNILLVDDHSIVLSGITMLLQLHLNNTIVDEASTSEIMFQKLLEKRYDIIVLDINMPNTDIHGVISRILSLFPKIKILIYTMSPEEVYAVRFYKLGIYGFLCKDAPKEHLILAINTILADEKYFSSATVKLISDIFLNGNKAQKNIFDMLSVREFEIMTHLIKGRRTKEIAGITNLHMSTIGTHKTRIFKKLGVDNVFELKKLTELYDLNIS